MAERVPDRDHARTAVECMAAVGVAEPVGGSLRRDTGYPGRLLDDAVDLAKKRAKVPNVRVVTYRRPGEYRNNIYSRLSGEPGAWPTLPSLDLFALVRGGTPQFMYLWIP